MDNKPQELKEVIADLQLIKEAIIKSDSIFNFIDIRKAVRSVTLIAGLIIAFFAVVSYYLGEYYESFGAVPLGIRIALYILIGLACCLVGFLKIGNFLKSARGIRNDINLDKLFSEIYTPRLLLLMIPNILVIILVTIFLCSKDLTSYIIPTLSILSGLMFLSTSPIFSLKEYNLLSMWLIATGLLSLFTAEIIHPMAVLGFTFSAGFIISSLLLYLDLPGHKS
ncbi:MAG: hypothetical protein SCJ97_03195 [Bacillota bacterium]|nr:hypothetical protein [Bacillota bacterium]